MSESKPEYHFKPEPPRVLVTTYEYVEGLQEEARQQEMEQCCKDVCGWCKEYPEPMYYDEKTELTVHIYLQTGERFACSASNIRQRWAKRKGGKDEQNIL